MPTLNTFAELRELAKLGEPITTDMWRSAQLSLLAENKFPATAWAVGEPARVYVDSFADSMSQLKYDISNLADGASIITATTRAQQDRVGLSQYAEARKDPTFTRGKFRLINSSVVSANVQAGALIRTASGPLLTYRNDALVTVPALGTFEIDVTAYEVGVKHNIPTDQALQLVTAVPGVSVTNPAVGLTQTWITALGSDPESLLEYKERLIRKWTELSTGSPLPAYELWALLFQGVTRARADGSLGYGQINLYVDNAARVADVQDYVQPAAGYGRAPFGATVTTIAATIQNVQIPSTVQVKRQFRAQVEARVAESMAQLSSATDIGGRLVKSEIIKRIKGCFEISTDVDAVTDFQFNDAQWVGSPNLQLANGKIPLISTAQVNYVEV